MTKKLIIYLFFLGALIAQDPKKIIDDAEDAVKGKSAVGKIKMLITTPDYDRELVMETWWVGNEKALLKILSPRKEKGNKTLKIGNEMWGYLRNTETTIKIPPSMMLQSWNGSDFTNDDLVRSSNLTNDYTQKYLGIENKENQDCWKIQLDPKPDAPVVWGKLLYWVNKGNRLPVRIDYYDEKGKLIRYMTFTDIKQFGDRKIPSKQTMVNLVKKGNSTSFELVNMKFDVKIKNKIFSFRELERGN